MAEFLTLSIKIKNFKTFSEAQTMSRLQEVIQPKTQKLLMEM